MLIYKATNLINNKSYIGQTQNSLKQRKNEHINHAKSNRYSMIFHKAIRKYGNDNFKWEVLCECNDIDELNKMEKHHIKEHNTFIDNGNGYNMTTGGDGYTVSEETRKKMSRTRTGKKASDKAIQSKMGKNNHMYGKYGKNNPNFGRKQSKETKSKISKSNKGRVGGFLNKLHSNETKQKMSEKKLGKNHPMWGKKQPKIKCPHCNKKGGNTGMKRWHFDKCDINKTHLDEK